MRIAVRSRSMAAAGLTLIEMTVSLAMLGLVGYTLLRAMEMGTDSQMVVSRTVSENEAIRGAASRMRNELRISSDSVLSIIVLPDGNHQVTFMQPIIVGGAPDWGVYDRLRGPDEMARNLKDWSVRYSVDAVPVGPLEVNRRLLREVLDDAGVVQKTDILIEGLRSGGDDPPGFTMLQAGDMWEVTLTTVGHNTGNRGRGTAFHVRTRN